MSAFSAPARPAVDVAVLQGEIEAIFGFRCSVPSSVAGGQDTDASVLRATTTEGQEVAVKVSRRAGRPGGLLVSDHRRAGATGNPDPLPTFVGLACHHLHDLSRENRIPVSGYDWLDDDAFCATFVRGLTPREALARLGIDVFDGDDEEGDFEEGLICARSAEGGTILSESNGFAGTLPEVLRPLSAGTVTASVFVNVNRVASFDHYADGRNILTFDPLFGGDEAGIPEDYLADRIELGLAGDKSEGGLAAALLLAERITEVRPNASSDVVAAHGVLEY